MNTNDKVELFDKANQFERLVDALAGLNDRQVKMLQLHLTNAQLPHGERDEELMGELLDARLASRRYTSPLQKRVNDVLALTGEDHATKSRDYGRGFAEALRIVHALLQEGT